MGHPYTPTHFTCPSTSPSLEREWVRVERRGWLNLLTSCSQDGRGAPDEKQGLNEGGRWGWPRPLPLPGDNPLQGAEAEPQGAGVLAGLRSQGLCAGEGAGSCSSSGSLALWPPLIPYLLPAHPCHTLHTSSICLSSPWHRNQCQGPGVLSGGGRSG